MAKKKQFVTAAAAFAVAASAVAPAITADAASSTVQLKSDYVRGGDLDAALDKEYKGSEIYWYKSSVDMNKLGVFQTAKGFVKGQGIRVEKRVRVLNFAQEIKPESEFVFEQGVPVSGIRIQPVLFADGNEYAKPLSVAGFNTDKVGEFEGTLTYANKAYGTVTKTVKYKVVATKVAFSEVKHEVKDDMLSVSADVKNLKEGEKVELVIFPGKDESKALDPYAAEIKDGKVMVSAKDIPAGTHSFILRSGDVKTAAMEFTVAEQGLKVEGANADNLKNIKVSFNKAVDEDTLTASNVKVYDGTTLLSGVTLNLLEDEKTLLITNNGTYTQNKEYKVVVENVEQKDSDVKVKSFESSVKVLDTTLPTVESVNVLSPKTVEILFSEPIQTGAGAGQFPTSAGVLTNIVQVDGINLYATPDVTKVVTGNKVTLTLNTALTAGNHKVKVNNLNDFANLPITAKEFDVNVPTDTVAPEATSVEVINKDKVKVTFSEPVDNATVQANLSNIKVNNTAVTAASAKDGGVAYEFTLGSSLNLGAVVESTLTYKGIKDNYGNTVSDVKTLKFKAEDDITAPTITSTVVNSNNTVEVTFSEDVTGFVGSSSVELYDKDNKKLANTVTVAKKSIDGTPSDKVYTLTISGASSLSGSYSLKVLKDNVTDLSIRTNKFSEAMLPITLNDKVAPTVSKAEFVNEGPDFNSDADLKDSKLTIYFSEAMDVSTLTNKSNYLINGTPLSDVSGATLIPASDNKSVTIMVNRGSADSQETFATSSDVRLIAVKDAAGNTLDSAQVNANLGSAGLNLISGFVATPAFTSVVASAEAVAKNQIKLTAVSGQTFAGIDANKIKFAENQSATDLVPTLQVTSVSIAADGKSAVLTLNNELSADRKIDGNDAGSVVSNVSIYADANAITLSSGAKTAVEASTGGYVAIDKIDPALSSSNPITVGADTDEIRVTFDEALDLASTDTARLAGIANDLVVTIDGTKLDVTKGEFVVLADGNDDATFAIQVLKDGIDSTDTVTVELTNGRYVLDAAGNTAKSFAATSIKSGDMINEKVAPTAVAYATNNNSFKVVSPTQITLVFSEQLDAATFTASATNGFAVAGGTSGLTKAELGSDGKTVTLTGTNFVSGTTTVAYTAGTVADKAGNLLANISATPTN
ncbi:Ig-like domain-containing protein [Thalassospira sp. MA62]|nr:Ig-like domain-containing protein [Thalassospira sp. MA62]